MSEEKSLEGWVPELSKVLNLAQVVEMAFDYRGNTTIIKADGTEVVGYIFNRDSNPPDPYLEYFDEEGHGPFSLGYRDILNIKFTGKDTAAGKSWEAWVKRREQEKAGAQGQTQDVSS